MSRPSFRPRPIDLTKPLPIVCSGTELRVDEDVVVNRALPAIATGVDPSEETERHLKQALMASVYGEDGKAAVDIPIPVVNRVEPPGRKGGLWKRPLQYIMFDKSDHDLEEDCVDYDADHIDERFVKKLGGGVEMDAFERAIDSIEKIQGRWDGGEGLIGYVGVKAVLTECLAGVTEMVKREVYQYWIKRRTERGGPFLRLYQPPPDPSNSDPSVAFRPRDREGGSGKRRMNTYENFKRATVVRDEMLMLKKVLDRVIEREKQKTVLLGLKLLQLRVKVSADGGPRVEAVNRAIFSGEQEPVAVYGPPTMPIMVPCRNLVLPADIEIFHKRLTNPAVDKATKKVRRKAVTRTGAEKAKGHLVAANAEQKPASSATSNGVDTYGFDEHGNKFLKHMRYFAGGFMNYGVSPYDHRVFAAASERNTVRVDPKEPKPVDFPGPSVRFGTIRDKKTVVKGAVLENGQMITTEEICKDILGEKRLAKFNPAIDRRNPKRQKVFRVRGRVGRGGRIILDRVVFERERGVKAASYPASVEMGGVYTAGLPLDSAKEVAKEVHSGGLGEIAKLAGDFDEEAKDDENDEVRLERKLIPALKPMMPLNPGIGVSPEVVNYWPRRGGKHRGGKRGPKEVVENSNKASARDFEEEYRRLPAYARREKPLVSEYEEEDSNS